MRIFVMMKRRSFRFVQYLEFADQHLDFAGRHVRIDRPLGTRAHRAGDLQHIFAADFFGHGENFGRIRIEDDLQQTLAITKVDKNNAAMISPSMHPPGHLDDLTDVSERISPHNVCALLVTCWDGLELLTGASGGRGAG